MTLRDKVGQLIVIHSYGEARGTRSKEFRKYVHAVRDLRVGGIAVVNRVAGGIARSAEPHAMAAFLNRMQRLARVPLIAGADFERGASMRVAGTAKFPHLMAYGAANDTALTRALGAATAKEARALGIHWVFAPDADVNHNPENPIINIRSFGEDPKLVAKHVQAFIQGAHSDRSAPVLVTAKHFPGHGDTNVDSHMALPVLGADRGRIESTELEPFRSAILAGVDSVMTAHMAVPALGESEETPATVSRKILTGVLREQLGFNSLIVTDAMDMQGLAKLFSSGEAAVRALEAGIDVLLMPVDPDAAVDGILNAVNEGRLTVARIEESVTRILRAKARLGLHRQSLVNMERISDVVESKEFSQEAQTAADRAVTLVRNDAGTLPLKSGDQLCFWVLAESRSGQAGRRFQDEIRARDPDAKTVLLVPQLTETEAVELAGEAQDCRKHVVAAFASTGAYRDSRGLAAAYGPLMDKLAAMGAPLVLISHGNPYLLRNYPSVTSYVATFSTAPTAEAASVRALFGEIPFRGTLPISIPGLAKAGDGLSRAGIGDQ